jgi:hypothetical protein
MKNPRSAVLRKITTLGLAAIIILSTLSCAKSGDDNAATGDTDSQTAEADDTRLYADVPVVDYNGYIFNALYWYNGSWDWRRSKDIYAEEGNGDTIGEAVYKRNLAVAEKYNIGFKLTEESYDTLNATLHKNVASGDDIYTIVSQIQGMVSNLITNGDLYDISMLPYVDLSKPWWDKNSVAEYSVAHKLYLVASDILINDKDGTAAIAFSKQSATDNQLPDLYELARSGEWTFDTMESTYKSVARDVNGDSVMDENDFYGFLGGRDVAATFYQGGGALLVAKDANDIPYIAFQSDRNYSLAQRIYDLVTKTDIFYDHHAMGTDDAQYQKLFEEGHGLYFWMRLDAVSDMRSSENEFGILPIPKYTDDQNGYSCIVSVHTCSLLSVPSVTQNLERTGVLLEALAAESKYTLMYAYYDVALKTKFSRDEESAEMLDLIFANRVFDLGELFNPANIRDLVLSATEKKSNDIASLYKKIEKLATKELDKIVAKIEKLNA